MRLTSLFALLIYRDARSVKIIELDLTGCKTLYELHERIRAAFDFPEWYGKNWDDFDDLLCSECDADKVIIKEKTPYQKIWKDG